MGKYFYHGLESYYGSYGSSVSLMVKILNEGIITRKKARNLDEDFDHVCLFQKNDDMDYEEDMIHSAYAGWIGNCFVFIINGDIEARKAIVGKETNLKDEWRCDKDISTSDIVGIALPHEIIDEYLEETFDETDAEYKDQQLLKSSLEMLNQIIKERNLMVYDSCVRNFTDEIDASRRK